MVRVRFAPSPTGFLHVGGARTALFNYLYAKHTDGKLILRIEDTDVARSTKESEDQLIEALLWLGVTWDEGPDVGGNYGPYRQSERKDLYEKLSKDLIKEGMAYEVYAYPEEIEKIHDDLMEKGLPPHYKQEMFEPFNTPERKEELKAKGELPAIFFKLPSKEYRLVDMIKGEVIFKEGALGDFVIMRSNGLPTYNFAVVVDDMLMEITDVIRGDDHLSNTLKQIALYDAFKAPIPRFAHVSMILGPDGKKLSKRHGATSLEEFRDKGFLPESFSNFLALLGWSHPEGKEIMSINEMSEKFSLERIKTSAAIFDETKATWMNGVYIRESDIERVTELAVPYMISSGLATEEIIRANWKWLLKAVDSVRKGAETIADIPEKLQVYFDAFEPENFVAENDVEKLVAKTYREIAETIDNSDSWSKEIAVSIIKKAIKNNKPDRKLFYMTLRKILTGREEGPELVDVIYLLGRNKVLNRLQKAVYL